MIQAQKSDKETIINILSASFDANKSEQIKSDAVDGMTYFEYHDDHNGCCAGKLIVTQHIKNNKSL